MFLACLTYIALSFGLPQNAPALNNDYLQGIWAEDLTESPAFFIVQGDSIYYTENPFRPYFFTLTCINQLEIAFDGFNEIVRVDVLNDSTMTFLDEKGQPELLLHKR